MLYHTNTITLQHILQNQAKLTKTLHTNLVSHLASTHPFPSCLSLRMKITASATHQLAKQRFNINKMSANMKLTTRPQTLATSPQSQPVQQYNTHITHGSIIIKQNNTSWGIANSYLPM